MPTLDEELDAADRLLKEAIAEVRVLGYRMGCFDHEVAAIAKMLESVRMVVVNQRMALLHAKEQIG